MNQTFPNGFESWAETHFEVSKAVSRAFTNLLSEPSQLIIDAIEGGGYFALHALSVQITNEFEELKRGRNWDGEFLDELVDFLEERLK